MLRKSCLLVLIAGFLNSAYSQQASFDGKTWWEHVKVLAADDMEGRDTGSPGLKRAEAYAVGQLKDAGLQPADVDGRLAAHVLAFAEQALTPATRAPDRSASMVR